jgi:hypothetical protein
MDMRTLDHHLRMETLDIISATQLGAMGQHSRSASGHRHPLRRPLFYCTVLADPPDLVRLESEG